MKNYWVYILSSKKKGTLYVGVTNDIARRSFEHKEKIVKGFTEKYDVDLLVHAERFEDINDAIRREKTLKKWNRDWKIKLIEGHNPEWNDLYNSII